MGQGVMEGSMVGVSNGCGSNRWSMNGTSDGSRNTIKGAMQAMGQGTIEGTMNGSDSNRRSDGSVSNARSDGSEIKGAMDQGPIERATDQEAIEGML